MYSCSASCWVFRSPLPSGLASVAYLLSAGIPLVVIPQKMYAGMDVFVLLCIPGFILAGNLMNSGGITERIIRFRQRYRRLDSWWLGADQCGQLHAVWRYFRHGGGGCGFHRRHDDSGHEKGWLPGGLFRSGDRRLVHSRADHSAQRADDYRRHYAGISVGKMFLASAIPGILMGLAMMVTVYLIAVKQRFPRQPTGPVSADCCAPLAAHSGPLP
ncbi:MAG: TRAP transporter large permease subunit [Thiolinea sp.]